MYAQDTAGDLDGAIKIYRGILAAAASNRAVLANAQYRLAQALLQKGDLDGAVQEFQRLAAGYAEYRELIGNLAGGHFGSLAANRKVTLGTIQNGRYNHAATGVQLTIPADCSVFLDTPSSDGGEMVVIGRQGIQISVWLIAENQQPGEQAALVQHDLENKPTQRPAGWKVRPESIRTGGVGNARWLSATADMTVSGVKVVEMVTWYRTTKVHAFFAGVVLPADLVKYESRFAELVSTAVVP
jgi:hypothetical protein